MNQATEDQKIWVKYQLVDGNIKKSFTIQPQSHRVMINEINCRKWYNNAEQKGIIPESAETNFTLPSAISTYYQQHSDWK